MASVQTLRTTSWGKSSEHPSQRDVGVCKDKGSDVEPLRTDLPVLVLDEVDVGFFEVQEPVCATERFAQVGSFIGVADDDGRFVTVARTLTNEPDGQVSGRREPDAGLRPHAINDIAGCGFY